MLKNPKYIASIIFFISLFTPTHEIHFFWEKLPVFNVLFGFFGCALIIFVSKKLGKLFIQRREDYYD